LGGDILVDFQHVSVEEDQLLDLSHVWMAFSVLTEFTARPGKKREHPRGMALVTRMAALHAEEEKNEAQWHPRA
jgi:hypothetical protein